MPQAPSHLQAMFEDDSDAWSKLENNFVDNSGVIRPMLPEYEPTPDDYKAIDYLILEWDYGYQPN